MTNPDNEQSKLRSDEPQFAMRRIYCKDISYESPQSPNIFKEDWHPEVSLGINNSSSMLEESDVYEVVLTITAKVKNNDRMAFIVEVSQAGIFSITNLDDEQLQHTLGAFCPNMLFPYIRETIDGLINKGSFPVLMLAPINFDHLYQQALEKESAGAGTISSTSKDEVAMN